jgi:hypothetical protein
MDLPFTKSVSFPMNQGNMSETPLPTIRNIKPEANNHRCGRRCRRIHLSCLRDWRDIFARCPSCVRGAPLFKLGRAMLQNSAIISNEPSRKSHENQFFWMKKFRIFAP